MRDGPVLSLAVAVVVAAAAHAGAQSVRDHTRLTPDRSTVVTEAQANELRLTVVETAMRPIQVWVRTAGVVDAAGRTLSAVLPPAEAGLVRPGQRVRAFPPESRSSMYQARVSDVTARTNGSVVVRATLAGPAREGSVRYILEIVAEAGDFLSVPNEAIIESEGRRLVYVQQQGRYRPREIQSGLQGELFTQVIEGLKEGEQVVTFGSFFIDADHKLKGS